MLLDFWPVFWLPNIVIGNRPNGLVRVLSFLSLTFCLFLGATRFRFVRIVLPMVDVNFSRDSSVNQSTCSCRNLTSLQFDLIQIESRLLHHITCTQLWCIVRVLLSLIDAKNCECGSRVKNCFLVRVRFLQSVQIWTRYYLFDVVYYGFRLRDINSV